jgi:hypothetical protein
MADDHVDDIVKYLPRYQDHIKALKEEGHVIVGYCRKSPGDDKNRTMLLQAMIDRLKERSLTVKCYVSLVSSASKPLSSRDLQDTTSILKDIHCAEGNTQGIYFGMFMRKSIDGDAKIYSADLISFLTSTECSVCLVAVDFAGLTTNPNDLFMCTK